MAACLPPSAVRIADCRCPSAVRIAARLSRSARICFSIESLIDGGGSMPLSSTRLTRIPHLPVASSSTPRSRLLISSRLVSACSRSMPPTMLRSVVIGQLLDGLDVVGDLVRRRDRVGDLEVDDRVDGDDQVVLGDHRLRRERDHLLAQVDHVARPCRRTGRRCSAPPAGSLVVPEAARRCRRAPAARSAPSWRARPRRTARPGSADQCCGHRLPPSVNFLVVLARSTGESGGCLRSRARDRCTSAVAPLIWKTSTLRPGSMTRSSS